jgi:hypothetical protein
MVKGGATMPRPGESIMAPLAIGGAVGSPQPAGNADEMRLGERETEPLPRGGCGREDPRGVPTAAMNSCEWEGA